MHHRVESQDKAKKMTAIVGVKVSDNSPADWVYKRFPASFEEVGKVHNKVEGTEVSSPKVWEAGRYDDFHNVHNGAVHNGAVHNGAVHNGTVQDSVVKNNKKIGPGCTFRCSSQQGCQE